MVLRSKITKIKIYMLFDTTAFAKMDTTLIQHIRKLKQSKRSDLFTVISTRKRFLHTNYTIRSSNSTTTTNHLAKTKIHLQNAGKVS